MSKLAEELAAKIRDITMTKNYVAWPTLDPLIALLEPHLVGEWLPIESAPKDGSVVLLVWDWDSGIGKGRTVITAPWICRKHSHSSRHHNCPNEPDCDMGWSAYAGNFPFWQPLPVAPPKGEQSA